MNYFDGKFLILFLGLVHSALSFSNDVTLSIGISIISTLTVCVILSIIAWNCCLRSQGAKKHQFDVEQEGNKGFVMANYDNTVNCNTAKIGNPTTVQCPKCGHRIERTNVANEGSGEAQRNSSLKNKSNGWKGGKVEVLVHNNSRSLNSTTETTHSSNLQKLSTNKEESSIAPASEERSTFVVKLKKTDSGSLGLSIVGGRSSRLGDIGVFIKSTIDNTPAASNGQLKPWDQILKVNNVELDGRTLEEALMIIKEQSTDITLTILPSEQATAHLEASLSIKASQMDDNKLKTEWSSLREEEITSADSGTMKDSSSPPPPQENNQSPRPTDKPSAKLPNNGTDNGTDLATELLGDGGFMTSSLGSVTLQHRKTVVSSSGLTDSESSLSPVPENTFNARDDDVFFSMSPQSYSNSRGDTADGVIHTDDVMLNGEDFIYEENHGYQGGIETDAINVDLDIVVK